jgi:L-ascorbate metabolism protein UlaG (beta-lactamase superfamily)
LIKVGPSAHDNTLATGADGGPAASYFVNFDNGTSIFYSGHATMIADLAIYASVYQPQVAILGLTEPAEFAQVARLMAMNNPRLRTIIPSHIRPRAPILNQARQELERVGLADLLFMPELRQPYEYYRSSEQKRERSGPGQTAPSSVRCLSLAVGKLP